MAKRQTIRFSDAAEKNLDILRTHLLSVTPEGASDWTDTAVIAHALAVAVQSLKMPSKPPAKARRRPR